MPGRPGMNRAIRNKQGGLTLADGSEIPRTPAQTTFQPQVTPSVAPVNQNQVQVKPELDKTPTQAAKESSHTEVAPEPAPVKVEASHVSVSNASEAISGAQERFDEDLATDTNTRPKKGGRPPKTGSPSVQVRVPRELFDEVKRMFPSLNNREAMSAFIALFSDSVEFLEDKKTIAAVMGAKKAQDVASGTDEKLDKLIKVLQTMRREVAVSSIASVAVLSDWYRRLDTGLDLERYLGLNDTVFEAMEHLNSMSTEYEKQVQQANGRRVRGYRE